MKKYISLSLVTLFFIGCGGSGDGATSTSMTTSGQNQGVLGVELTVATPEINNTTTDSSSALLSESSEPIERSKTALSNTGTAVKSMFNGYELEVVSSKVLEQNEETSQSTIAVYGTINQYATESLLKINTNYVDSNITVLVFKDNNLVAESETFKVNSIDAINFSEITIN
ncbi:MAG: Unknown protein [uncultured Sulfurovum sp.]|uniref:Lipoprotein n=1 Tax=uncultured Sulfurovum sp. TaxID=269237 RepID=A0A6S6SYZ1_9BACT|nr:MAG: Unknown protein [uncultured Sulfurovum sp.]